MIRIGLCDDNLTLREKYQRMIEKVMVESKKQFEIQVFRDGQEVIKQLKMMHDAIDIIFLDILMRDLNGVDTARMMREMNFNGVIIFLTSSEEYLFDASDTKPQAYLMKDQLGVEGMKKVLDTAINKIEGQKKEKEALQRLNVSFEARLEDISYIKKMTDHCIAYHQDGSEHVFKDLKLLELLNKEDFYEVQKDCIIAFRYIQKIEDDNIYLLDASHSVIPINAREIRDIKLAFTSFMLKRL